MILESKHCYLHKKYQTGDIYFELFNHASFYDVIFSTLNAKPMNFTKSCQIILQEHLLVLMMY